MFDEFLEEFRRVFDQTIHDVKELRKAVNEILSSIRSLPPKEYGTKKYRKKNKSYIKPLKNQYVKQINRHLPYQRHRY